MSAVAGVDRIRVDRVNWENRVFYEIRPDTRSAIRDMEAHRQLRADIMNRAHPTDRQGQNRPWEMRIANYRSDRAYRVLLEQEELSAEDALGILRYLWFDTQSSLFP